MAWPSVPILKEGDVLIASIQSALTDLDLVGLRDHVQAVHVGHTARRRQQGRQYLDKGGLTRAVGAQQPE